MSWLASLGVGVLSGIVGFTAAFLVATAAIEWLRIPSREGSAGYFGMAISLLALLLGAALGLVCARQISAGESPTFLKAWGLASAIIVALALLALLLIWLLADLPPKWQGRRLELAIELRCPAGYTPPPLADAADAYVTIIRLPDSSAAGWSQLRFNEARTEDGHLIVPGLIDLDTSAPDKALSVRLGKDHELRFPIGFGTTPTDKDSTWSRWIDAAASRDTTPAPSPSAFQMRYRVQPQPPPARALSNDELRAEEQAKMETEFRALPADAPLNAWLRFTRYGNPEDRQREAAAAIRRRPGFQQEMSDAILGTDLEMTAEALRSFPHFEEPPVELAATVARVGKDIGAELRAMHELAADDPERESRASSISQKFSAWMEAVAALEGRDGLTFVPQLQEIAHLSRQQPISYVISINVLRVASFYLQKWAGMAPLPDDPPPR